MKIESWNNHNIRFVEKDGEWWAVLKDVCDALGLRTDNVKDRLEKDHCSTGPLSKDPLSKGPLSNDPLSRVIIPTAGGAQKMLIVNEFGIYDTIFQSRKPEAKAFRIWVYEMLRTLRENAGLQGFEVFRTLDKKHQLEQMEKLRNALQEPVRVDFIKANTITNRTVSTMYGSPRMLKKGEMTPKMLATREKVLQDTVDVMSLNERANLGLSVSDVVYKMHSPTRETPNK